MKRLVPMLLLALSVLAGLAAYTATRGTAEPRPRVEVPAVVDLGTQVHHCVADVEFEIRNAGDTALDIWNVTSDYAYLGMAIRGERGFESLTRATIAPGASLKPTIRLNLHDAPDKSLTRWGRSYRGCVQFQTSDPDRPQVQVDVVAQIQGFWVASPAEVRIDTLLRGRSETRRIDILETGVFDPRPVDRVECDGDDILRVVAVRPAGEAKEPEANVTGRRAAEIEVAVQAPQQVGRVNGRLRVFLRDRPEPILTIPVTANVVAPLQASPAEVTLPRMGGGGKVYEATFLVQRTDGYPCEPRVVESPPGVTVRVNPPADGSLKSLVTVAWDHQSHPATSPRETRTIRLAADVAGRTEEVTLTVVCVRGD